MGKPADFASTLEKGSALDWTITITNLQARFANTTISATNLGKIAQ